MKVMEAALWVTSVCVGLRKNKIKTLSDLVAAGLRVGRVSLSELDPLLAQKRRGAVKHAIKRMWRFTSNRHIEVSDAMQGPLRWIFDNRKFWKKRPLVVSVDWTQVGSFHTSMVARVSMDAECHSYGPATNNGSCTRVRTTWKKECCGC